MNSLIRPKQAGLVFPVVFGLEEFVDQQEKIKALIISFQKLSSQVELMKVTLRVAATSQ